MENKTRSYLKRSAILAILSNKLSSSAWQDWKECLDNVSTHFCCGFEMFTDDVIQASRLPRIYTSLYFWVYATSAFRIRCVRIFASTVNVGWSNGLKHLQTKILVNFVIYFLIVCVCVFFFFHEKLFVLKLAIIALCNRYIQNLLICELRWVFLLLSWMVCSIYQNLFM